jgi:hypothetical protein
LAEDDKHIGDMISFKLANGGDHVIRAQDREQVIALAGMNIPI